MKEYTELRQLAQADLSKRKEYLNASDDRKDDMIYFWILGYIAGEHEGWKRGFKDSNDIALAGIKSMSHE